MAVAIPLIAGGLGAWAGTSLGIGASLGWALGASAGSMIEQHFFGLPVPPNALTDLQVQTSSWGVGLPQVFGTQRLAGNIIWATDKLLVGGQQGKWGSKGGGGSKGAGFGKKGTGQQGYYVTGIAFALCEGPIGGIKRIWAGGDLIFDDGQPVYVPSMDPSVPQGGYHTFTSNNQPIVSTGGSSLGTWTLYHGTELQDADPTIAANGSGNGMEGVPYQLVTLANGFTYSYGSPQYGKLGTATAYRSVAYIVFPALNCGFGGSIPPLTFEIVGQPGTLDAPTIITPVYNPIPASLVDQGMGNYCYRAELVDSQTLCIPTGKCVCYCSITGQLKQYSDNELWPSFGGNAVNGVIQTSVGQTLFANYDVGTRPSNSNLPWTLLALDRAGAEPNPAFAFGSNVWKIDANYHFIFNPSLNSGPPNYYTGLDGPSFTSALALITGASPFIQLGNAIYMFANNGSGSALPQTICAFDVTSHLFTQYALPMNVGTTLYTIFTDGTYLYAVDTNYLIYKIALNGENPGTLISTIQLTIPTNGFFWANGWLYGFTSASQLLKFNADGSVRYMSSSVISESQHFLTSQGIIFLDGQRFSNTGATYFTVSYGDMTLTPVTYTLAQAITAICNRAGFTSVDVSLVPSIPVNFTRRAGTSARDILKVLSQIYQFDMVDSAGTLRIVPKGQPIAGQLSYDQIGFAKPVGPQGTAPPPYVWQRAQGTDLPRSVTFKYTSALVNYNQQAQFFQLHDPYGKDLIVQVPATLDDKTALTAAMLMCVEPHIERQAYTWTCSLNELQWEPGDVLQMPWGVTRITSVAIRNADKEPVLDFSGVIDASYVIWNGTGTPQAVSVPALAQPTVYQTPLPTASSGDLITATLQPAGQQQQVPTKPPLSIGTAYAQFLEVAPLTSSQNAPFYVVAPWTTGNTFVGAAIYESTDGGSTYNEVTQQAISGVVGWTPQVLGATQPYTWDTTSTVNVYLQSGYMQISSATDLQVIQGANLAQLGNELIQFANATLLTDSNGNAYYQLSRLLRGRRGTQSQMSTHVAGESFTLISGNDESDIGYALHDLNNEAYFKVATVGQSLSGITPTAFAPAGLWFKPFAPAHLSASVDGSNDWTISFFPVARLNGWWGSGYAPTLDPDSQTWSADVLKSGSVVRTLSGALSSPSILYTAAMQSADGFTAGQHGIVLNVYQVGQLGRGYSNTVTT